MCSLPPAPPPSPFRPRPSPLALGRRAVNGRVASNHQAGRGQPRAKPGAPFECHDVRRDLWRRPGKSRTKKKA
jgi:hypothetical protein